MSAELTVPAEKAGGLLLTAKLMTVALGTFAPAGVLWALDEVPTWLAAGCVAGQLILLGCVTAMAWGFHKPRPRGRTEQR